MLQVNSNYNTINYRYSGLPTSIVKPTDEIAFPLPDKAQKLVEQKHEQYLHSLYKVAKNLTHQKAILCYGTFNTNFFRSNYSKEQYLLLVISLQNQECVTFKVHYINHTYWGQDIEPECIAKFTTFDTSASLIKFRAKLSKDNFNHYYTAKHLLEDYGKLPSDNSFNNLSINLKMIDELFKPTEYYFLEKCSTSEKISMRLAHR